jgi:4-hydroxybenzoyl-CoA reductase subunit beta
MIAEKIYLKPNTVEDAIAAAHMHKSDFRYLAGGTDVLVNKHQGNDESACLIDLTGIAELKQVAVNGKHLKIGSLVRLDDLKKHEVIANIFPALLTAAQEVASPMLRKTATIGGNLLCENRCTFYNQSEWWREAVGYCLKCEGDVCIATGGKKACFSKFVSDTAPVLISLNAEIDIRDANGAHTKKLEAIYTGDGIKPRNIADTSVITAIFLPLDHHYKVAFRKLRPRNAVDFTSLTTAVSLSEHGNIKIAIGGMDPKPVIVEGLSGSNTDDLIKSALKKSRTVDNDYYSREYRRDMLKVFLEQSFDELL